MNWVALVLGLLLAACSLYYLAAIVAGLRFSKPGFRPPGVLAFTPPVSILKPVRGLDPGFYAAIHSHAAQEYPDFEILFAVRDPADPAVPEIRRLAAEFPARRIEVFITDRDFGPNGKVNSLERLSRECRHEILVISDSDIHVGLDYLRRIVAPLADPSVGLVTCPYRGVPEAYAGPGTPPGMPLANAGGSEAPIPSRDREGAVIKSKTRDQTGKMARLSALLESLWISTDFHAGVLVARALGMSFALGATMVVRRSAIDKAGGFAPLAAYLADDYQLSQTIAQQGSKIVLSDYVVETTLPIESWSHSWQHRLRWGRTLRVCRPGGYAGLIVIFALPLALAALAVNLPLWPLAALCVALRLLAAYVVAIRGLKDRVAGGVCALLIPLADLVSFAVWVASFFGSDVVWRGERFRIEKDGKLTKA